MMSSSILQAKARPIENNKTSNLVINITMFDLMMPEKTWSVGILHNMTFYNYEFRYSPKQPNTNAYIDSDGISNLA